MTVPYTFGTATTSIPLSNLDANFNTPITLGNTSIYLGNTTTSIGNLTLTNATISSGNVTISNVTVTTANVTNIAVAGRATFAASGFGAISASTGIMQGQTLYGGVLAGNGSSYDVMICNRSGSEVLGVIANTQNLYAAGTVGIGTSSPVNALQVAGAVAATGGAGGYAANMALLDVSGGNAQITAIGANTSTVGTLVFQAFSSNASLGGERMRIDTSGRLLVGTTTAVGILTVDGKDTYYGGYFTQGSASSVPVAVHNRGTSSNNVFVSFGTEASFTERGSITYNRAGGLTAYNVTSDYRAKNIIGSITNSGEIIDSVPVYMGKMKDATQERPMFIAHETPSYAHTGEKDAVDKDGKPVYQQMDASALVPVMWAEIQSLRQRIATLENK